MRRLLPALLAATIFVACGSPKPVTAPPAAAIVTPASPSTEAKPVTEVLHGVTVTDPYRWLEDQESPATRDWITRQNAYTDSILGKLPQKQRFAERIKSLLSTDQMSMPFVRGGRFFFTKRPLGKDQFAIYMRESANGPDMLLIDPTPLSPDHTVNVGIDDVSRDGKLLAYWIRRGGADETSSQFFDVDAKHDVGTPLASARYEGVSFNADGRTLYYAKTTKEGGRVFRRSVDGGAEEKLFGDGYGPEKIIVSGVSDDGRYELIHVFHGAAATKTEVYLKDLSNDGPIKTVVNDLAAKTLADFAGDMLVLQTNWDAPNDRVFVVSAADPGRANWKELVPENKKAALQSLSAAGGKVYLNYLEDVKPRVIAYGLDGKPQEEIRFDSLGSLSDVAGTWHQPMAFYRFQSFNIPPTTYAYDVASKTSSVFFRSAAPVDSDQFTVEQLWYASKDGTRIPMFVMYKKGLQRNGANPVYLTGYGGFTISELPTFSATAVTWCENGGVYAMPNLRGGGEFGEAWHKAGMLANKQNVFDDFIAAAQYLIEQRFTSQQHLGISGSSNGGLLVTAFTTQRPDLVKAVVCSYPLVDMLRFHKFLVGSYWVPEYGSADDAEQFKWIYAYSPYQHVTKGTKYPAFLFITGDADTRVAPLHARKMAALMQNSTGSSNPVMIRYHVSGGHSGGEPLNVQVNNSAETLAFLDWQLR